MSSWSEKKIKYIARINPSKSEAKRFPLSTEVTFLPMECISENGDLDLSNVKTIAETYSGFTYFAENDVIIAKITPCFENGKGALCKGLENGIGFGTTELHVLRAMEDIEPKYLYYVSMSHPFRNIGTAMMKGAAGQKRVTDEFISNYKVVFPNKKEQMLIVNFIDKSTQKLDDLILKKKKLVKLLLEKRQVIINEAVTKGLNRDVSMRDSGIEWLGTVPAHWDVSRVDYKATVKARLGWKGLKASEYVDDGYIFLATPNIKGQYIDFQNVNYITEQRYLESPEIMLQKDDVLLTKDGSTLGTVNVVRELPSPSTVNSSIAVIRPGEDLLGAYLYYFLSGDYLQQIIQRFKDGMGVPHLFQRDINKFPILVPPIEEQKELIKYLDEKRTSINLLIEKIEIQIEKLLEYRQSLIIEAVTGKIDVREYGKEVVK